LSGAETASEGYRDGGHRGYGENRPITDVPRRGSEDRIELTVIYKRAGKRYTLEVFKDNTAGDVIDALIESGLIKPSPGVGYAWALVSPRLLEIPYDEKILEALSPGENEVFLIAKPMGGP
jgi:hypothetical protein